MGGPLLFALCLLILFPLKFAECAVTFDEGVPQPLHRLSRRFDCSSFCRSTGYHGVIGGCRCGYVLFAKRMGVPLLQRTPGFHRQLNQLT